MSFKKINVGNSWCFLYYSFGPVLDEHGSADTKLGTLKLSAGDWVRVRWPDGVDELTTIVMRREILSFTDEMQVPNDVPHVRGDVHGFEVFVPLTALEVWDTSD